MQHLGSLARCAAIATLAACSPSAAPTAGRAPQATAKERLALEEEGAAASEPKVEAAPPEASLDAASLARWVPLRVVEVPTDAVYRKPKRYRAYRLADIAAKHPAVQRLGPEAEVGFHCADGYAPRVSLQALRQSGAALAVRDLDAPGGKDWVPFVEHGERVEPGPFFLVHAKPSEPWEFKWPHGIVRLTLHRGDSGLSAARPRSAVYEPGYKLFAHNCLVCHSMNGVGGGMAPDLNVPRNVLEYWEERHVRGVIRNPADYRLGSRMLPNPHLDEAELDALIAYMRHMGEHKVCESAEACQAFAEAR